MEPLNYVSKQKQNIFAQDFMFKQELGGSDIGLNFIDCDQFIQLPQLESPSFPLMKRPVSSTSITSLEKNHNKYKRPLTEDDENFDELISSKSKDKKKKASVMTTDWRSLDKFVASQLMSQEDGVPDFGVHQEDDTNKTGQCNNEESNNNGIEMPSSSLLRDREEENRFISGFLCTSLDYDLI